MKKSIHSYISFYDLSICNSPFKMKPKLCNQMYL